MCGSPTFNKVHLRLLLPQPCPPTTAAKTEAPHKVKEDTVLVRFALVFWGRSFQCWDGGKWDWKGWIRKHVGVGLGTSKLGSKCGDSVGSHKWACIYAWVWAREIALSSSFAPGRVFLRSISLKTCSVMGKSSCPPGVFQTTASVLYLYLLRLLVVLLF